MNIRTYQPGDERSQAALFNSVGFTLPGFKHATEDDVRKRTRGRGFDPGCRFYAEESGQMIGYCSLDCSQGRVSIPWCKKGYEAVAMPLFESVLNAARERKLKSIFAAYRRDWEQPLKFLEENGFIKVRDVINYMTDHADLPTVANRTGFGVRRITREDLPALAELGKGVIRLAAEQLEEYVFSNPYLPSQAFAALPAANGDAPAGVGVGYESGTWADVRKVDPLAPCFRMGAFGTEGLTTKRVNGLFSFVAKPENAIPAGLALLAEASKDMTEGTVAAIAAQCPSDATHLVGFYSRYFKEQGRFPVLVREL